MVIKILKFLGIAFLIFLILDVIAFIFFLSTGKLVGVENSATMICEIDKQKYQIEIGTNDYFTCDNCSDKMKQELKKITDFDYLDESISNIDYYFKIHNGTCE